MIRLSTVDLMDGKLGLAKGDVWIDHVLWDIPETLIAAVRSAGPSIKAMTFHENVFILKHKYEELFSLCEEKGVKMVLSKRDTHERDYDV